MFEQFYFDVSIFLSLLVIVLTAWKEKKYVAKDSLHEPNKVASIVCFALVVCCSLFRFYNSAHAFGGVFTPPDENLLSRITVNAIFSGKGAYTGTSQLTFILLYGLWYKIFGCCSVLTARLLQPTLAVFGQIFFYLWIRREFGRAEALVALVLFSLSTYLEFFSSLAIETMSGFVFVPLILLLLSYSKGKNLLFQAAVGVLVAMSLFTYPGVWFYLFFLLVSVAFFQRKQLLPWAKRRDTIVTLSFFVVTAFTYVCLHIFKYGPTQMSDLPFRGNAALPVGGGGIPSHVWQVANSFFTNTIDTFYGGNSIYLSLLPKNTFLESSLWGFFLLGLYFGLRRADWRLKALALSLLLSFLANFYVTVEPGMRRMIGALPVVYLFCAIGFLHFVQVLQAEWKLFLRALVIAIFVCLACNFFYLVPKRIRQPWLGKTPPLPEAVLVPHLKCGDVFLNPEEFEFDTSGLDAEASKGLADLIRWHDPTTLNGKVVLFTAKNAPKPEQDCSTYFYWQRGGRYTPESFWQEHGFAVVAESTKLFFQDKSLHEVVLRKVKFHNACDKSCYSF